jgi:hypothetical protein
MLRRYMYDKLLTLELLDQVQEAFHSQSHPTALSLNAENAAYR